VKLLNFIGTFFIPDPSPFEGTFYGMIRDMDPFAQIVMLVLLVMSLISWAITFQKIAVFRRANSETERFLSLFRKRPSIPEVYVACVKFRRTPLSPMLEEGFKELDQVLKVENGPRGAKHPVVTQSPILTTDSNQDKDRWDVIRMTLERVGQEEINRLEKSVVFLATTGNVSPFFGLLGTVWGIMHSFASIGVRGSASLAVVAPGIAEALVATIMGLAVAIPAVMAYNFFNAKLKVIASQVDNFGLEFLAAAKKEELLK
jgi:biopolymer transport protein TolQ